MYLLLLPSLGISEPFKLEIVGYVVIDCERIGMDRLVWLFLFFPFHLILVHHVVFCSKSALINHGFSMVSGFSGFHFVF